MDVNPDKLNTFIGKMLGDVGAAMNASLMLIGDKLGLYKTLAAKGPMNSSELAKATGTSERYVREWLAAQAASGYIEYDAASGKFSMTPEQNMVCGDEDSPVFMGAVGSLVSATFLDESKISEAFKTGNGVGWNRRSECLFCGTARFFRTGYKHHPVGAMKHVRETMANDGTCMLVEPFANDRLEDNLNPVGRIYYAASTVVCTPASLDQEVGMALGAQAGEARLRDVANKGGLTRFRRATETAFNLILEARA